MSYKQETRLVALQFAMTVVNGPNGRDYDVVNTARQMAMFIDGQDPVIDGEIDFDDDNVIEFYSKDVNSVH